MSALDCTTPGCENPGVIPFEIDADTQGWHCFEHAGIVAGDTPQIVAEAPLAFDADVANRFAAELLEAASVAMGGDEATINAVFESLVDQFDFPTQIVAGIQLALSMVIAAGAVPSADVLSLSETLRANAADADWVDQDPPPPASEVSPVLAGLGSDESPDPGTDAAHVCDACDGTGIAAKAHEDDDDEPCPACDGNGYLPEPSGPTIFDALADLDDAELDLPDSDPETVPATPDEGNESNDD